MRVVKEFVIPINFVILSESKGRVEGSIQNTEADPSTPAATASAQDDNNKTMEQ